MRADIVVFDGLDEMDALGPLEVLRSSRSLGGTIDARLVSRSAATEIVGAHGLSFRPDATFVPGEAEVLIVPGGGWASRNDVGAWGEAQRGEWLALLRESRTHCSLLTGVCTGTMLLAHAGLTTGRRVNTHRSAQDELRSMDVELVDERVVDDGDLITSGGVTSGIDLALWLVERECSRELADRVAQRMEYDRFRPSPVSTQPNE